MAISLQTAPKLLEPGLREVFKDEYLSKSTLIPDLFGVVTSDKKTEHYLTMVGGKGFQRFSGTVYEEDYTQGYQKDITNYSYTDSIVIDHEMIRYEQYGVMKNRMKDLASLARTSKEELAIDIFNHAFDTSYVVGDGLQLCSNSHTSPVSGVANQSNLGSTALSAAAISATRTLGRKFYLDSGRKAGMIFDSILCSLDKEAAALEALESTFKGDSTFTTNIVSSNYKPKLFVSEYLTDPYAWFYFSQEGAKRWNIWQNSIPMRLISSESTDTLELKETAVYGVGLGSVDWRWIYGHNATS